MILSQPTINETREKKIDQYQSILSKISPIFGFQYHIPKQTSHWQPIRNQARNKASKGIKLFSKQQKPHITSTPKILVCYINKWSQLIGNRMKITLKLYSKLNNKFTNPQNPQQHQMNQIQRIYRIIQQYRPDCKDTVMVSKCLVFFSRYLHTNKQQYKLMKIVIDACFNRNMLPFTSLSSGQQIGLCVDEIVGYLPQISINYNKYQKVIIQTVQLRVIVQQVLGNLWGYMQLIQGQFRQVLTTYLITNKFCKKSCAAFITVLLESNHGNYYIIINRCAYKAENNNYSVYSNPQTCMGTHFSLLRSIMPQQILKFCQLQNQSSHHNKSEQIYSKLSSFSSFRSLQNIWQRDDDETS